MDVRQWEVFPSPEEGHRYPPDPGVTTSSSRFFSTAGEPVVPIRVLAAVISRKGRYLICRRPDHKRHGGLWEFPGGKIEAGESDLQAADREMREELAVSATAVGAPFFVRLDDGSDFSIEFIPVEIEGTPREIEHSALAWVAAEDLLEYALAPSDRVFAEEYLAPSGSVEGS